jgi:hypothetical protein
MRAGLAARAANSAQSARPDLTSTTDESAFSAAFPTLTTSNPRSLK